MILCEPKFLQTLQEKHNDYRFLTFEGIYEFIHAKHSILSDEKVYVCFDLQEETKESALLLTKQYLNTILKCVRLRKHNVILYDVLDGPFMGEINSALRFYCEKAYKWTFHTLKEPEIFDNLQTYSDLFAIVASFYNENASWLEPYQKNVVLYNKGKQKFPKFDTVLDVPNFGRESETYLQYIIANYEHLPNVVLFTQGHCADHVSPETLLVSILQASTNGGYAAPENLKGSTHWNHIPHGGKYLHALKTGKMLKVDYSLAEFYEKLFPNRKLPLSCVYYRCGLFACTKECIQKNPKKFYENAYSLIPKHPDPEIGHYFERIWYYMFNEKNHWSYSV